MPACIDNWLIAADKADLVFTNTGFTNTIRPRPLLV